MNGINDFLMLGNVLQAQLPKEKTETRLLPDLICASCGNCERNYHKDDTNNQNNGFCVKFFQNVALDEKNVSCWTSKSNTYYEDLSKLRPQEKTKDFHKMQKRAKHLKIEFKETEQLDLFT